MKVVLDIKDEKAAFMMELLNNFKFVKAKPISSEDKEFYEGLKEAVEEVNLDKKGKIELKSARQLLDEL